MLPKSNNVNSVVFEKHTTTKDEIKALLARMPDFLTAKEIAHILRISVKTMYQWTQDNYLPRKEVAWMPPILEIRCYCMARATKINEKNSTRQASSKPHANRPPPSGGFFIPNPAPVRLYLFSRNI